jgi:hypothetical protein
MSVDKLPSEHGKASGSVDFAKERVGVHMRPTRHAGRKRRPLLVMTLIVMSHYWQRRQTEGFL